MMSSMSVTIPLLTNLQKLCESTSDSDLVDPIMYRQWVLSLISSLLIAPWSQLMVEVSQLHCVEHVLR